MAPKDKASLISFPFVTCNCAGRNSTSQPASTGKNCTHTIKMIAWGLVQNLGDFMATAYFGEKKTKREGEAGGLDGSGEIRTIWKTKKDLTESAASVCYGWRRQTDYTCTCVRTYGMTQRMLASLHFVTFDCFKCCMLFGCPNPLPQDCSEWRLRPYAAMHVN